MMQLSNCYPFSPADSLLRSCQRESDLEIILVHGALDWTKLNPLSIPSPNHAQCLCLFSLLLCSSFLLCCWNVLRAWSSTSILYWFNGKNFLTNFKRNGNQQLSTWGLSSVCGLKLTVVQAAVVIVANCAFMTGLHFHRQLVGSYNSQLQIPNYLSLTTGFSGAILALITCQIRWLKWVSLQVVWPEHLNSLVS